MFGLFEVEDFKVFVFLGELPPLPIVVSFAVLVGLIVIFLFLLRF